MSKPRIRIDSLALHDGDMEGISGRNVLSLQNQISRTLGIGEANGEHLIDYSQQRVEHGPNCLVPPDRDITVENFLKHLGAGHHALAIHDRALQEPTR